MHFFHPIDIEMTHFFKFFDNNLTNRCDDTFLFSYAFQMTMMVCDEVFYANIASAITAK